MVQRKYTRTCMQHMYIPPTTLCMYVCMYAAHVYTSYHIMYVCMYVGTQVGIKSWILFHS